MGRMRLAKMKLITITPGMIARAASASRQLSAVSTARSEEHTSELQSRLHLVCRLLLEKKKRYNHAALNKGTRRVIAASHDFQIQFQVTGGSANSAHPTASRPLTQCRPSQRCRGNAQDN